jgi:hypothetical protein
MLLNLNGQRNLNVITSPEASEFDLLAMGGQDLS